jgi:hypothetical protein
MASKNKNAKKGDTMIVPPAPDPDSNVPGMSLWGWMGESELRWLRQQAESMTSIVEVGSLLGRSSMALLTGCKGPVYCIDPWDDPHGHGWPTFNTNVGHFPNLVAIRGFSPGIGWQIPGDIDMVFVDGDHSPESCMADLEYWFPRTKKLICGHDYTHPSFPGVKQSVDKFFSLERMLVSVAPDTSIWNVRLP